MTGSTRRICLVLPPLPAIVIAWTGLSLATVTAVGQTPPVRGAASGELRTPSGFSPMDLQRSEASAAASSRSPADRLTQSPITAGKTPIRRDPAREDDVHASRRGIGSSWTALGAFAAVLIGVVAATRLLRRWSRHTRNALPPHLFDVLAARRLDGQASIHLVRIGRRIVAVGSSPAGVQPLAVVDDPDEVEDLVGNRTSEIGGRTWANQEPKRLIPAPNGDVRLRTPDLRPGVMAPRGARAEVRDA